jgi:putative phosphoribosyl transferase
MHSRPVRIPAHHADLEGTLELPGNPTGLVIFAHGSGPGRHSARNDEVAWILRHNGIGTLLVDLLTSEEAQDYSSHFDRVLLAERLKAATRWARAHVATGHLPLGYIGSSTWAAAALTAAADLGNHIAAVVSSGGRPDLVQEDALALVTAPTLLLVGSHDEIVIPLNERAYAALNCEKLLRLIPGASHLFEEPGTLEQAAIFAADWFKRHFPTAA